MTENPPIKKKRRKPIKSVTLAVNRLKQLGQVPAIVERIIHPGHGPPILAAEIVHPGNGPPPIRFDAWGFADVLAFIPGRAGMRAYQICGGMGGGSMAAHRAKILAEPRARQFLSCPGNKIGLLCVGRGKRRGDGTRFKFEWINSEEFNNEKT